MTEAQRYTASEILAILSARQLQDGQVVFAGIGVPLLAATLAQRTRCPALTILFEGGVVGAFVEPGKLPPSTNDQRCTKRANMVLGSADVLLLLQRGLRRCRLHGRRPDRSVRQSELVVHRRSGEAEDAPAGYRRRQ
ncbi:acyl CoA:acetate/3-ketoacid CoA transferase beta subunit [Bradyrhizobium sp. USDA 4350]